MTEAVLVDGHVHIHGFFPLGAFLDAAADNFGRAAKRLGLSLQSPGVLMLTECAGVDRFEELDGSIGRWSFRATAEAESRRGSRHGGRPLFVVSGRQIVTRERIEVLALGTRQQFPDGEPAVTTLQNVADSGALPVLPWGFGKWWFDRGEVVERLLDSSVGRTLCLGDNGGRLRFTGQPRLFRVAAKRGLLVLPGSDPLPIAGQHLRVASYGFVLPGPIDSERPAEGIRRGLERSATLPCFGTRAGLLEFVRAQLTMQLRARKRG